jgi:hypothetical protein
MAIAGLFPTFTFQVEIITPNQGRLFNIVHVLNQYPERQGEEEVRRSLTPRCKEIIAKRKKGAAAIAFERERGYKKKAQRKRGSHAPRLGRGRRPRGMGRPALKRNRR